MAKLKSARHHWWPRCVSSHWAGNDDKTGWIKPDGTCRRMPPYLLGALSNAHHIKLGERGGSTVWDQSFEDEFDVADSHFPAVITWLEALPRHFTTAPRMQDRFLSQSVNDGELRRLTECVVSLAIRSPMNREASVALAEQFRGPLEKRERNSLIGANMRNSQRLASDSIGGHAKFAVLYSAGHEFIFGDGFFHNLTGVVNRPQFPTIVAPITPNIGVVIHRPMAYVVEPRLSTIVLSNDEVDSCNHAVQVYARNALFFRNDKPLIDAAFERAEHLQYSHPDNPVSQLVRSIPGIPARDSSLDFLFDATRTE